MAGTGRVYRIGSMELVATLWDWAVHLDQNLSLFVKQNGVWVYALLFVIVFCETGLVVTPFLPGDSLLFVAGLGAMPHARYIAFCAAGAALWVGSLCLAGYFFGNLPVVQENLTVVIIGIVLLSVSPAVFAFLRQKLIQREG